MPDNQNGWGSIPAVWALGPGYGWGGGYGNYGGFGNGLFGGGFGNGFLGGILGGLIPGLFGGWGNGFGGWGGNGSGAAASLGSQATANANAEMIMNAINGTDADVRLLATTLNGDVDSIRLAINTVQGAIQELSATTGLTGQQIINAIQSGNAALSQQLCQCCCQMQQQVAAQGYENQLRTVEQTNTLGSAIAASGQRTVDSIADLKTTIVKEFCDLKERDMQEKINTLTANNALLRSQIDNANQTAAITGYINSLVSPIAKEVDDIKCKLPNTVSVNWPNLAAVNMTPYVSGGFYQGGFNGIYGNGVPGFGNGLNF